MKKILIAILAATAFLVSYHSGHSQAYPAGGIYGRAEYRGYFTNSFDVNGTYVLDNDFGGNAFPASVNSAASFISFIESQLGGDNQQRTGASFIIQTMIGSSRNRPPTAAEIADWRSRVLAMEAQTRVQWFFGYSYSVNSYFQGNRGGSGTNDDAFFDEFGSGTAIVFFNPNGSTYAIRRQCANPVGIPQPLPPASNFDMVGSSTVNNATPRPGDTLQFSHTVRNNGPTSTGGTVIWWGSRDSNSGAVVVWGNPAGTFAAGQQRSFNDPPYTIPAGTPAGTQICRQVYYDPGGSGNGSESGPPVCAVVRYDYTLTPSITIEINDGATPGAFAEPGDKVEFIYAVNNAGTTQSQSTSCTIYGLKRTGFYTVPSPPDSASDPGYVQPPHGCPRTFPFSSNTTLFTPPETIAPVPVSDVNKSICRSLYISPSSATSAAPASTEVCVRIVAKPYLKVYGGDISAGAGQTVTPGTCTNNGNASIIGWNKGPTGAYGGASAQYAAMALGRIYNVATSFNNGAGAAPVPGGLAFANTSAPGGSYGGLFGSLPCINDYFSTKPAVPTAFTTIPAATTSGAYATSGPGPFTISGAVPAGRRIVLYVQGDVYIDNNITYPASWNAADTPLFQLAVKGNIYIKNTVTQLAGIYIAQPNGAAGGTIYTCATGAAPLNPSGTLYSTCNTGLTINGAFVAKDVRFLRTDGTLQAGTGTEAAGSGNIAEVFTFSPALWMAQPVGTNNGPIKYDSITALPPVL